MNYPNTNLPESVGPDSPQALLDNAPERRFMTAQNDTGEAHGEYVQIDGKDWYKISNSHRMADFFISIVSSSNHWMFVSSSGALTAGRRNADSSLFPYYCSDKISDAATNTGPRTLLRIRHEGGPWCLWEPFATAPIRTGQRTRNLYKNSLGTRILFEEFNHALGVVFRYSWATGHQYGFVRRCEILNQGEGRIEVELCDGIENIVPSGLGKDFQLRYSNLADAYKKNELLSESGLAVYYLSSIPTDRAEASEGMQATVAWQTGLGNQCIALSSESLDAFARGDGLTSQPDVRGRRGAYFASKSFVCEPGDSRTWNIVADVNCDHGDVVQLHRQLELGGDMSAELERDVQANEDRLLQIISAADGRQVGADQRRAQRHQSNVLFNVMRGGIPANGYTVNVADFEKHVRNANRHVRNRSDGLISTLPSTIHFDELQSRVAQSGDADLIRITCEYLPLCFSRRHGDPTRPWNEFSIDVWDSSGDANLSYEGNWRDIFQNWEALAVAYPRWIGPMIFRFVNASSADGYNPYRISKDGFEWEVPDDDDPWSNIGYWGDHQIIYLLKLLEIGRSMMPGVLDDCLSKQICTYANIPYRIRSYEDIRRDPSETIDFDRKHADKIEQLVASMGADGKLLTTQSGVPYGVGLVEKLLVPLLAKLTNFVPGGGVWLNTQRPEWNDANNALVGHGLSVVTACHLRRYLTFLIDWFSSSRESLPSTVIMSREVWSLANEVNAAIVGNAASFDGPIDDQARKRILDRLSIAGSNYRTNLYDNALSGDQESTTLPSLVEFFRNARKMIDHTIEQNRRDDGMYHAYNLLSLNNETASVSHLHEMLEGQVAVLSSGILSAAQSVEVLDALRHSRMYREDQNSYMLYPDRDLPTFLEKNCLPPDHAYQSQLLRKLVADSDLSIVRPDADGNLRFHSDFRNVADLRVAIDRLRTHSQYETLIDRERELVDQIFEDTFGHRNFTGRSGTFFAYEGLGSIYWHMVSKLALAVLDQCVQTRQSGIEPDSDILQRLHHHYREIRDGIGLTKTPPQYGAFPTDPYSHTPRDAGVQQPGMTGQVKEDILSRWVEVGIRMDDGKLSFDPAFFEATEFSETDSELEFFNLHGNRERLPVPAGCFAMTLCQVPVVYRRTTDGTSGLVIARNGAPSLRRADLSLTASESESLFARKGEVTFLEVSFDPNRV
ncbi:hypothetical protein Poly51_27570 [Rubripirellula tenax]|uniref:Cellobiose phosphorylase n=1 Tax=Rubripirellula tenax TaxID=2528015 RepID=A0A5C6F8A8_9BACT|nr:hypothetical protein [Rubripirellula tenax]TWU56840.1 hypothetical protein Poly51_27570 [Rubripirellula tenax]